MLAHFLTRHHDRFILLLPLCLGTGILLYFACPTEPSLPAACAAMLACGALVVLLWRWKLARAMAWSAMFVAAGFTLACARTARLPPFAPLPLHGVVIEGRITQLDILPVGRRITLAAPSLDGEAPLARALRIRVRNSDREALMPGDVVRVRALVRAPAPPDYPGGWDTQREAFFAGLDGYGFAIGPVIMLRHAPGLVWGAAWWGTVRARVAARIMADLPGARGAVAATLLTGLGGAIAPDDRAAFQQSGLAHLLAVAGLHVGIVMALAFGMTRGLLAASTRAALYWPTRQIAALAALAAGLGYLALTGAHVPILRSFAMAALVTLAVVTGRRALSLRGLALAALALLLLAPESVVGVSFQMSFAAVLSLIAGYEAARPWLAALGEGGWWRRTLLLLGGVALTSLLAGTASLPFAMYHFGTATLYYVPANLLAVPLTSFWVMPWGIAALLLMPLGLAGLALAPMGWGIGGLLAIAHAVAAWPGALWPVAQMPAWGLVLVSAGLAWAGLLRGRLRLLGCLPLLVGTASPWLVRPPDILLAPEARLIALRVGADVAVAQSAAATKFDLDAPARLWGGGVLQPISAVSGSSCDDVACRLVVAGQKLLLPLAPAGASCDAALIVATIAVHVACPHLSVFDRATGLAEGAITLWLGPGQVRAWSDLAARGMRPWVIRAPPTLPMAPIE